MRFLSLATFYREFRQMILYTVIGLLTSVLDLVVYAMFVYVIGLHYIVANIVGVLASVPIGFFLNRNVNFMTLDKTLIRFLSFLVVGVSGALVTSIMLYVCIDVYHFGKISSKLFSIISVSLLQFILNKCVTFKSITNMQQGVSKTNQELEVINDESFTV